MNSQEATEGIYHEIWNNRDEQKFEIPHSADVLDLVK